jgi:hypothetical protein
MPLPALRLVEMPMPITLAEVETLLSSARDRHLLLLLTETSKAIPKVKPGIPALSYKVLDRLTEEDGPLDEALTSFIKQRPRVLYRRLLLDRNDTAVMARLGVVWLPQVRLIRSGRVLFRSSVSVGDNGHFLAQDVGGRSFVRRTAVPASGLVNLTDALSAEIDRPRSI